ncbi:MAG: PEGA domain-containing protein [Candidatus Roizmanbacteria bacterium]|nr:PEGA domain-containing protein [Candidatus Roizmanbacteria bacterium]
MKIFMRLLWMLLVAGSVILVSGAIYLFASGYQFNLSTQSLQGKGIIITNSYPNDSELIINGKLEGVTPKTLYLSPGTYTVSIQKEGYTKWTKTYHIKQEVVYRTDALLFYLNPSLSPLTNRGVIRPTRSSSGDVVVYIKPEVEQVTAPLPSEEESSGIFLRSLGSRTLSLFSGTNLLLPFSQFPGNADLTKTEMLFSPDEKNLLVLFHTEDDTLITVYLISIANPDSYLDVSLSFQTLLERWNNEAQDLREKIIEAQHQKIQQALRKGTYLLQFSPDDKKLLYFGIDTVSLPRVINPPIQSTSPVAEARTIRPGFFYVYDIKEDRNYELNLFPQQSQTLLQGVAQLSQTQNVNQSDYVQRMLQRQSLFGSIAWFSNSKNLVLNQEDTISMIEYDGKNRTVVYSGPFEQSLFGTTSDGRVLILTNLNPKRNALPDLYAISIK